MSGSADVLLREATRCKGVGDWDTAVECLRRAYRLIDAGTTIYPIATFLRLPMYLHQSGRKQEAWEEFRVLLARTQSARTREDKQFAFFDRADIADKIRLCLQRDRMHVQAVKYGVVSWLSHVAARKIQSAGRFGRDIALSELEYLTDRECISGHVEGLLKKANRLDLTEALTAMVCVQIRSLPDDLDMNAAASAVDRLLGTQ